MPIEIAQYLHYRHLFRSHRELFFSQSSPLWGLLTFQLLAIWIGEVVHSKGHHVADCISVWLNKIVCLIVSTNIFKERWMRIPLNLQKAVKFSWVVKLFTNQRIFSFQERDGTCRSSASAFVLTALGSRRAFSSRTSSTSPSSASVCDLELSQLSTSPSGTFSTSTNWTTGRGCSFSKEIPKRNVCSLFNREVPLSIETLFKKKSIYMSV